MIEWLDSLPPYTLPLLIFLARVVDVSIGTIRIIMVTRGKKYLAACLGFFEMLVWALALGQVMSHLNSPTTYISFALGFSVGNFVGILLESKLALGYLIVRIISHQDATKLIETLRAKPYGMTTLEAQGKRGKVSILFTVIRRKGLGEVIDLIHQYTPEAFYSVEDIRAISEGDFFAETPVHRRRFLDPLRFLRKEK
jgi:uncharacterized protein YebE (UPF0316 family)